MSKKVLIVDDERNICELIGHILKEKGYKIEIAHNGVECLKKVKSFDPDLILLDVNMPQADGLQVLEHLRNIKKTRKLPVIMCTERNGMDDIHKADRFGISGYITKPFVVERVLKKVEEAIANKE